MPRGRPTKLTPETQKTIVDAIQLGSTYELASQAAGIACNTGEKQEKRKPGTFERGAGKDPRINRKGRPKSFDALRSLAQEIAHEAAKKSKEQGGGPVVIDGHVVTVTEAIMRQWAMSKDPRLQQKFIEVAYGQVPSVTRLEGQDGGPIQVTITRKAESMGADATPDD